MKKSSLALCSVALLALVAMGLGAPSGSAQEAEPPHHEHSDDPRFIEQGYLGVSVRPLNEELRRHFGAPGERGVLVARVSASSPAAAAGVEVGDVLVSVDGRTISSAGALDRVVRARGGETVALEVYRDGERADLTAQLEIRQKRAPHHVHVWRHEHHEDHHHDGWADFAEHWAEFGEGWAEWGAAFGERWAEWGARFGERWAERGEEWGEIGAEFGEEMAEAFVDMDWDEIDRAVDESMRALDEIDWDAIGDDIDRAMEELEVVLEDTLEELGDGAP